MPVEIPHLAYPFAFDAAGRVKVVEQDSVDEIAGCAAAILKYPLGSRRSVPDFGVPPQVFVDGGANLDEIRSALDAYEPRAVPTLDLDDDRLAEFVQTVTAGVG